VTNPPIDAIREELVISTEVMVGAESNMLEPTPQSCHQIRLEYPLMKNEDMAKIKYGKIPGFASTVLPILFPVGSGGVGLEQAMENMFKAADAAIARGFNLIVLSDRGMDKENAPIPALLAIAGMHHHLIRQGKRTQVGLILESGEPREIHHFAALIGYGATAINPYLAYEAVEDLVTQGVLNGTEPKKAVMNFIKAATKGIVKTLSKMGISSIQSYCGAQIFEAIGIHQSVIDKYFTWTPSRIGGIDIGIIAQEAEMRHKLGYPKRQLATNVLPTGGEYQWRNEGEYHLFNPLTIHKLQKAVRNNSYADFK
jgi:glutamate synthase (ferredoxin)